MLELIIKLMKSTKVITSKTLYYRFSLNQQQKTTGKFISRKKKHKTYLKFSSISCASLEKRIIIQMKYFRIYKAKSVNENKLSRNVACQFHILCLHGKINQRPILFYYFKYILTTHSYIYKKYFVQKFSLYKECFKFGRYYSAILLILKFIYFLLQVSCTV